MRVVGAHVALPAVLAAPLRLEAIRLRMRIDPGDQGYCSKNRFIIQPPHPDSSLHESPPLLQHAGLGIVPEVSPFCTADPAKKVGKNSPSCLRVAPQPFCQRGRPGKDLALYGLRIDLKSHHQSRLLTPHLRQRYPCLLGPHGRLPAQDESSDGGISGVVSAIGQQLVQVVVVDALPAWIEREKKLFVTTFERFHLVRKLFGTPRHEATRENVA